MSLEEIRQELITLTDMNKNSEDSFMSSMRRGLQPHLPTKPTHTEVEQKKVELEAKIPGFFIIWDRVNSCYGIIPDA
jgi:hypothetical protein